MCNKIQSGIVFHTAVSSTETVEHAALTPAEHSDFTNVLWFNNTACQRDCVYRIVCLSLLLFLDRDAQYMIILFMVFIVQFSVSSACLAINSEQQVR